MTSKTIRSKFAQGDPEVRRAAALASGHQNQMEHVPDLIQLLEDLVPDLAEPASKHVSGQDSGPGQKTDELRRALAIATCQIWWKQEKMK